MDARPAANRSASFRGALVGAVSLAVMVGAWALVPAPADAVGMVFRAAMIVAGGAGLLGAALLARGHGNAYPATWAAAGCLLALALPAFFSIGLLFVAAAVLLVLALAGTASATGRAWRDPASLVAAMLAFGATEGCVLLAVFSAAPVGGK